MKPGIYRLVDGNGNDLPTLMAHVLFVCDPHDGRQKMVAIGYVFDTMFEGRRNWPGLWDKDGKGSSSQKTWNLGDLVVEV